MITEDYCSYEVAKLLKEKEFDEKCPSYYRVQDSKIDLLWNHFEGKLISNSELNQYFVSAPTHQMAMKWLREKGVYLNIRIALSRMEDDVINNIHWVVDILNFSSGDWKDNDIWADTYEEAVEAALKHVLENLI